MFYNIFILLNKKNRFNMEDYSRSWRVLQGVVASVSEVCEFNKLIVDIGRKAVVELFYKSGNDVFVYRSILSSDCTNRYNTLGNFSGSVACRNRFIGLRYYSTSIDQFSMIPVDSLVKRVDKVYWEVMYALYINPKKFNIIYAQLLLKYAPYRRDMAAQDVNFFYEFHIPYMRKVYRSYGNHVPRDVLDKNSSLENHKIFSIYAHSLVQKRIEFNYKIDVGYKVLCTVIEELFNFLLEMKNDWLYEWGNEELYLVAYMLFVGADVMNTYGSEASPYRTVWEYVSYYSNAWIGDPVGVYKGKCNELYRYFFCEKIPYIATNTISNHTMDYCNLLNKYVTYVENLDVLHLPHVDSRYNIPYYSYIIYHPSIIEQPSGHFCGRPPIGYLCGRPFKSSFFTEPIYSDILNDLQFGFADIKPLHFDIWLKHFFEKSFEPVMHYIFNTSEARSELEYWLHMASTSFDYFSVKYDSLRVSGAVCEDSRLDKYVDIHMDLATKSLCSFIEPYLRSLNNKLIAIQPRPLRLFMFYLFYEYIIGSRSINYLDFYMNDLDNTRCLYLTQQHEDASLFFENVLYYFYNKKCLSPNDNYVRYGVGLRTRFGSRRFYVTSIRFGNQFRAMHGFGLSKFLIKSSASFYRAYVDNSAFVSGVIDPTRPVTVSDELLKFLNECRKFDEKEMLSLEEFRGLATRGNEFLGELSHSIGFMHSFRYHVCNTSFIRSMQKEQEDPYRSAGEGTFIGDVRCLKQSAMHLRNSTSRVICNNRNDVEYFLADYGINLNDSFLSSHSLIYILIDTPQEKTVLTIDSSEYKERAFEVQNKIYKFCSDMDNINSITVKTYEDLILEGRIDGANKIVGESYRQLRSIGKDYKFLEKCESATPVIRKLMFFGESLPDRLLRDTMIGHKPSSQKLSTYLAKSSISTPASSQDCSTMNDKWLEEIPVEVARCGDNV